ncbi:MAG: penicillin-binding transpeptidase domain-containing protein [Clostridia bacterium]|nr:penicillin-binding transpeptidase domain-containing protein [Clostridia bacterium]
MHNGMKTSMKRVFWILVVLFLLILGTLVKLEAFDRQTIASNSYNARLGYGNEDFKRGSIYDTNGNVMAESVDYGNGYEREYPYGKSAAHITGYTGAGAAGIEAVENFNLMGLDNEVSQRVKNLFSGGDLTGDDVYLTIDMDIQELAYSLLGKNKGAAVVMDPTTGSVIAMASTPSFDPNTVRDDWAELASNEDSPMLNRATQGLYPPGSTFKIVTALTSLRNINNIEDFRFQCEGETDIGDKTIHCFNSKAHGVLSIDDAMAYSCNSAFATLGNEAGGGKLRETADSLHMNSDISFDLPLSQTIMSLTRMSSKSELAETSIGQGKTLVTPLYMAMLVSSVANDGVMMQPYMVEKITDGNGNTKKTTVPQVYDTVMTAEEADRLTQMLVEVVNRGTGTAAKLRGYQAAGKTGTAENAREYDHSWFVGFAPADNPKVAVAVILENVSGSARATPIGGRLMQAVLDKQDSGKISGSNYTYTPPASNEDTHGDDINSDQKNIDDTVLPEDDYVIGSDVIGANGEGGGMNTENGGLNGGDGQNGQSPGSESPPGDSSGNGEGGTGETQGGQTGNENGEGSGQTSASGNYKDEDGHYLTVVNK